MSVYTSFVPRSLCAPLPIIQRREVYIKQLRQLYKKAAESAAFFVNYNTKTGCRHQNPSAAHYTAVASTVEAQIVA